MFITRLLIFSCFLHAFTALSQTPTLSLEKCYELIKENPQIIRQRYSSDLSSITVEQLRANRIPSINAAASQNFNFGRSIDPFSNQFIQRQIASNNFSLNSSLVLFNGFQNSRQIEQNKHLYLANEYATQKLTNDLATNAANIYFEILMNQEQLRTLYVQTENTSQKLEKTEKLVRNGTSIEADMIQLEAQQFNERNTILDLKNRIHISKNNLCLILNIPFDSTLTLTLENELRMDALTNYKFNRDNFPQINESNERLQAAYYSYLASKGSRLPRLVLNAGITTLYSNQNKQNVGEAILRSNMIGLVDNDPSMPVYYTSRSFNTKTVSFPDQIDQNLSQYINLQLQIPILNNKTISSNIKRAIINQRIAETNKDIASNQLETDVNQVRINYQTSISKLFNANVQLDLRKKYFMTMEKRYEAGISDLYVLLLEKNNVINTEIEQVRLKYEAMFYERMLDFYAKGSF